MGISYDEFTKEFLSKITEFELLGVSPENRTEIVDGYMKRAILQFSKVCKYDLISSYDDDLRQISIDIPMNDRYEIVDIVSEGMIVQWMKPYVYRQELLENLLNTRDYTVYSPSELLMRVGNAYEKVKKDYLRMMRNYSYNHGDLSGLHS